MSRWYSKGNSIYIYIYIYSIVLFSTEVRHVDEFFGSKSPWLHFSLNPRCAEHDPYYAAMRDDWRLATGDWLMYHSRHQLHIYMNINLAWVRCGQCVR
jgi:hypothetical protein